MMKNRIKFGALLAVMLIMSMALVPAVSAAEALNENTFPEIVTTELPELIAEPLPELPVNSASATEHHPYWYLIEADNKEQKTLFEYIDNSYVSKEEKQEMKKGMKDIWHRYPDQITEEDNVMLERVETATAEYLNDVYGKKDVGAAWSSNTVHPDLIYIATTKWGISSTYKNLAKNAADDPDGWGDLSEFWQKYNHYYDPSIGFGYGAMNSGKFANDAKNYHDSDQLANAYTNLGYSSHYMSDLGNPMHTGEEARQFVFQWVHNDYELYVRTNWTSGHEYKDTVNAVNTYYVITNPEQSAENLASYSHADLDTLYAKVYYNRDTFGSDPEVITITDRVLHETAKYNLGLVKYMRG